MMSSTQASRRVLQSAKHLCPTGHVRPNIPIHAATSGHEVEWQPSGELWRTLNTQGLPVKYLASIAFDRSGNLFAGGVRR